VNKLVLPVCALVCAVVALPLFAASYVVAPDDVFVRKSDVVVLARVVSSHVRETPDTGIETVYQFSVAETLKGDSQTTVTLSIPGGVMNGHAKIIGGAPTFAIGAEYLLFLSARAGGAQTLTDFALGAFAFSDQGIRHVVQRGGEIFGWDLDGSPHRERLRDAAAFLDYIREVGRGGTPEARYFVSMPSTGTATSLSGRAHTDATAFAGSTYTIFITSGVGCPSGGCGTRWTNFPGAVSWQTGNTEPGAPGTPAGTTAVTTAFGAWNGAGANINYTLGSTNTGNLNGITDGPPNGDGINNIVFEKDLSAFAPQFNCATGGLLGIGGIHNATSALNAKNGENYWTTTEGDVSMNKGIANCTTLFNSGDFNSAVTHEVGHTLGFRHSDQDRNDDVGNTCTPATMECTNTAIMNHQVPNGLSAHLQSYDLNAVATVYGSGPVCTNPGISGQPAGSTITQGQSANLTVTATGTSPTYQWYVGNPPTTSSPVPSGTAASIFVSPTTTTTYWVRVSACSTSVDSNAATVTVNPPVCNVPQITSQPQNQTTTSGTPTQLTVGATGTALTYQLYAGNTGDTSSPIQNGTTATIFVSPIATSNYWVRVSGQCGTPQNSNTVTVTIGACPTPTIQGASALQTSIQSGQSATLSASVSNAGGGAQWYVGTPPDKSNPVPQSGATVIVSPTVSTNYWLQASSSCGAAAVNSSIVAVTVGSTPPPCVPPTITTQPSSQQVVAGLSTILNVNASGTATLHYQWYKGPAGNKSKPVGGDSSSITSDAVNSTLQYWVEVTNACTNGVAQSVTATLTPFVSRHRSSRH